MTSAAYATTGSPPHTQSYNRPRRLILDVVGLYLRDLGNWIAVSHLVTLMGSLQVDEQAVRSAVSRMSRRGLLVAERRAGVRGYRLSEESLLRVEAADRRVLVHSGPADLDDGWVLVSFSVPEAERDKRHVLRSRLTWLGFGNLSSSLWLAPRRILPDLRDMVEETKLQDYVAVFEGAYRGFDDLETVVRTSWDLAGLSAMYREFLDFCQPLLDRWDRPRARPKGEEAFVDYTLALNSYRTFPYLDPGLPIELLPPDWAGHAAAESFFALRRRLEPAANSYVLDVVQGRA